MLDLPRPITHKLIYIGGLGVGEPKPLDEKFSRIMSKGSKGVVIVSMGTIAPFYAFSDAVKSAFVKVFQSMTDYHFVLKITKTHPRLKLFFMHGGVNGLMEAMLRGVPVVVVPIFADQFRNGRNVEKRGVGKVGYVGLGIWSSDGI
ncbi:unnamed protein product [Nippostrongylus brasiliensis]|uniref:glucuronosyltransferase n=1 Tax=Nippostrongylus brasiliensis TaxID=27835 RepID=A0A0N4XNC1_NIPBR|nr:unnamed protein product [Nippostrongylus brasiliensis]